MIERGNSLSTDLWRKSQTNGFHEFILFWCRLIVYSWRRSTVTDGSVKTTPQKTRFRSVNNWQGIQVQVKVNKWGTLMTTEMMTRMRRATNTTTCLTWTQTWSMWTRTSTPTEDSWVSFVCLFCSVSLVSTSFDSLHITLWLKWAQGLEFVPHSFHSHRHVSCARWVTLSSTSPSFSSSSLASSTSFCSSPFLR